MAFEDIDDDDEDTQHPDDTKVVTRELAIAYLMREYSHTEEIATEIVDQHKHILKVAN